MLRVFLCVITLLCVSLAFAQDQAKDRKTGQSGNNSDTYVTTVVKVPDSVQVPIASTVDIRRVQTNWKKLRRGMSYDEVERLLGKPTKITCSAFDASATFYYGSRIVVFDNVKNTTRFWDKELPH